MKKIKYLLVSLILVMCIGVWASNDATNTKLSIDCDKNSFAYNSSLTCDVNLTYSDTSVSNISFDYNTSDANLLLAFSKSNGRIDVSSGKVTVTMDNPLSSNTETKLSIAKVTVTAGASLKTGSYDINLTNVKANSDATLDLTNVKKSVSYVAQSDVEIDCTLESISINSVNLSNFAKTKYEYTGITSKERVISVDARLTNEKASVTGLGQALLMENKENAIELIVNVAPGSVYKCKKESKYILKVTYNKDYAGDTIATASTDNTISLLELYNGDEKLDFTFDSKKTSFNYKTDLEKITIKANLNDNKATFVSKYGPRDVSLNYGKNKVEIKVKAESGDTKTYTLNIEREDTRSSDNTLSSLSINGKEVTLEKDKYEYEIDITKETVKTEVNYKTTDDKATVKYQDIEFSEEEDNILLIEVTSEDNKKAEYKIKINLVEAPKHLLENITIKGYNFPFNKETKTYDLDITKETNELEITVSPKDNVDVVVVGNRDLKDNSTVTIQVTDDDGEKTYTMNMHKESDRIINIICYSVFGLGIVMFLASVIYATKKKKN